MHGDRLATAQWAAGEQFTKTNSYRDGAIFLGRGTDDQSLLGNFDDRHVMVVAGIRSGKGASVVVPNACLWPGSLVVVDPTGDVANFVAGRRGRGGPYCDGMGQAVYVLDPYEVSKVDKQYRATFNPLEFIDPASPSLLENAQAIADALVADSEKYDEWALSGARRLITAVTLHVLTDPRYAKCRNMGKVCDLILRGDPETEETARQEGLTLDPFQWLWLEMRRNSAIQGRGEEFALMLRDAPAQWTGIRDLAVEATDFINNEKMRSCLSSSSFSLRDLKREQKGTSLFITIPSRRKSKDFRWLRLMVSLIMDEMESNRNPPACGHATLMMIDEFASLQKMDRIETGISEFAKFDLKIFIVLQNLPQLKKIYEEGWEIFWSGCGTKIIFGIEDQFTREYVSTQIGETEIMRITGAETESTGSTESQNETRSESKNTQKSQSQSRVDSYKRGVMGLRDTAGFVRKLFGSADASDSRESGTSSGQSTEVGSSSGTANTTERGSTRTEQLHKRPLVTPDELGRFFRRIDDDSNPRYPGIAVAIISTIEDPAIFQRVYYFNDDFFSRKYMPEEGKQSPATLQAQRKERSRQEQKRAAAESRAKRGSEVAQKIFALEKEDKDFFASDGIKIVIAIATIWLLMGFYGVAGVVFSADLFGAAKLLLIVAALLGLLFFFMRKTIRRRIALDELHDQADAMLADQEPIN
jgi:type IV secretory pathway TraG/TraD family ATPase VirD4